MLLKEPDQEPVENIFSFPKMEYTPGVFIRKGIGGDQ